MNLTNKAIIVGLALGASAIVAVAQNDGNQDNQDPRPPRRERPAGPGMDRPMPPIMAVLDANKDGVIDATEIANASAALKTLDKNGDGQLTIEELRPRRGQGQGPGPNGPRGPRGPRGPQQPAGEASAE